MSSNLVSPWFTLHGRAMRGVRQSVHRLERAGYTCRIGRTGQVPATELQAAWAAANAWRQRPVEDGLLDELSLNVCPIVVGSGMHLFDEMTDQVRLKLVESTTLSTGVLGVTYQPASA
jgi:hypothetical protein